MAYAGTDALYVPATQLDPWCASTSAAGRTPARTRSSSKLGGADWEQAKSRAKAAVKDLAKGLIQLYAQRQRQPGYAFSPDSPWQKEFEDEFRVHRDGRPAAVHRGDQAGHGDRPAHGPAAVRRRGLRQDGGGLPGGDEVRAGRQAGGHSGAHHRAGPAALPHRQAPLCQVSGGDRGGLAASALPPR